MVVCIRVRAPRRDWVLFRSIVSQTNGVHVVSSEDIMFSQTGRTNRKWTAVSFTLRDKYGLSRRRWCSASIIPAVSASSFQHRKSFDSSRSERETVRTTVFHRFYPLNIIRSLRAECEEIFDLWWKEMETISSSPFNAESFLVERNPDWIYLDEDESVSNVNFSKNGSNRRGKEEEDCSLSIFFSIK